MQEAVENLTPAPARRDTKSVGQLSEVMVMGALVRAGYFVSIPFGENSRYDLIAEKDDRLFRVQVKTGRLRKGAIVFNCYSSHTHRKGPCCKPYWNQIDCFGIYCRELETSYLLPINATSHMSGALRVDPPRNGQLKKVRWASTYILPDGRKR